MKGMRRLNGWRGAAVAVVWLAALPVVAGLSRREMDELFEEGKHCFRQANEVAVKDPEAARDLYLKAILRFERIVRDGSVRNGKLYYNIGNAYFRMKDIGRAILNYRRAEAYIPRDPNLQQNLAAARARRTDVVEDREPARVFRTLFFWHHDLAVKTRFYLFACGFALFWLAAAARLATPRRGLGWMLGCGALMAVLFGGSVAVETVWRARERPGVVLAAQTVARKGDGETYEPSFKDPLHAGTEFVLVESRKGWHLVQLADGKQCWVSARDAELVR